MGELNLKDAADAETPSVAGENHGEGADEGDHGNAVVTITVDNKPVNIHRGRQSVSEIKRLGGVPAADELAQVNEGQPLKPLADDGHVVIKGGEEFVSYPKDSSSAFLGVVE
jgi:hypothetical protein